MQSWQFYILYKYYWKTTDTKAKASVHRDKQKTQEDDRFINSANIQVYCRALGHLNYMQWIYVLT